MEVTLADGRVGRYRYDALGRRSAVRLDGSMVRRYVYGGAEFPRARLDADGDVLERYVYASQEHVPDLIVRRDGQRLRLTTDALGSVRAVVDADTGVVVQRLAYDAYGRVTQDTAPGLQPFGYKGSFSDPLAAGAGLVWMGVRAYLPAIGRFTTVDSAGLLAGWNQHDALGSDPINRIDPDGRFAPLVAYGVYMAGAAAVTVIANDIAQNPENWHATGEAIKALCVDAFNSAWDLAEDAVGGDEDGEAAPRPVHAPTDPATGVPLPLPQGKHGERVPHEGADGAPVDEPHTQIGTREGSKGPYAQTREWGAGGELLERVDWTDHGRAGHGDPHAHPWLGEEVGWGPAQPRR